MKSEPPSFSAKFEHPHPLPFTQPHPVVHTKTPRRRPLALSSPRQPRSSSPIPFPIADPARLDPVPHRRPRKTRSKKKKKEAEIIGWKFCADEIGGSSAVPD